MKNTLLFFFIITLSHYSFSQEKEIILDKMKKNVSYLASDKLEGRKTGTRGEKRAAKYIAQQFETHNLIEKGSQKYHQKFKGKLQHHHDQSSLKKEI